MRQREGFTLTEVLMVSALLGLLSTAVFEVVHVARQFATRAARHYDAAAHARAALHSLEADLAAALPLEPSHFKALSESAEGPFPGLLALVTTRRLQPLDLPSDTDVIHVEYRLVARDGDPGPFALLRRVTVLPPLSAVPNPRLFVEPRELDAFETVAEQVESLALRFHDGRQWRPEWKGGGLPRLVEASLRTRSQKGLPALRSRTTVALPCGGPAKESS